MIRSPNPDPGPLPPARASARELSAWLRLTLTHGVGPATALTLLRAFRSPDRLLGASHQAVTQVVGAAFATRLLSPDPDIDDQVNQALAWSRMPGRRLLTLADPDYPQRLLDIADPPPLLYVQGEVASLSTPMLAIVGSRHASLGGLDNARAFATDLAAQGLTIVSGLAQGIDAAAHEGALQADQGRTVAVLGTGVDRVYPAGHRALAQRIPSRGALISELPLATPPRRSHFPRRNRLIAGLAAGVLVVEAARESGSLITARLANEAGREIFAIPGSIHSPQSKGCHQLIREGARLVDCVQDILAELGPVSPSPGGQARAGSTGPNPLDVRCGDPGTADRLLSIVGWEAVSVDSLLLMPEFDAPSLEQILLVLELDGRIERLADGRVRQRRPPD